MIGLLALGVCLALAFINAWPSAKAPHIARPRILRSVHRVVEAPPPLPAAPTAEIMAVSQDEAKAINARMAISTAPVEIARPFLLRPVERMESGPAADEALESRAMAIDCLTTAIYYEAASESAQGQRAVAQVVLNRVRHPAFPKSVCGVVYQGMERTTGCQFSFTCDGSLARRPSEAGWDRARRIAIAALEGKVEPTVGTATHYHTDWVVPYWAPSLDKITMIGAHIFYRWKGYWGHRAAFDGAYAGESMTGVPVRMAYDGLSDPMAEARPMDAKIRPLADQVAMAVAPAHALALKAAPKLRADENRGTLMVDQQPAMLDEARLRGGTGAKGTP